MLVLFQNQWPEWNRSCHIYNVSSMSEPMAWTITHILDSIQGHPKTQ